MKINVSDMTRPQLNWAVAQIEGVRLSGANLSYMRKTYGDDCISNGHIQYNPAGDWGQGGPLVAREMLGKNGRLVIRDCTPAAQQFDVFAAAYRGHNGDKGRVQFGPTPLIAAMRCYVASKRGLEVEIPEELA